MGIPFVAIETSKETREAIAAGVLWHFTARANIENIVKQRFPTPDTNGNNAEVHLRAGQGWSVAPFRLLRDYSVLDFELPGASSYGKYLYFFLGEPSWWGRFKNLNTFKSVDELQDALGVVRINGCDVISKSYPTFYRADDRAVVVRSDYLGPASVVP